MRSDATPAAERRLHPLTVVFAAGKVARSLVFPAVVGGISVGQGQADRIVAWALVALTVPAILAAVFRWLFFRYALAADELVIRSGMLSRTHRVIPLARVQNVEVRQGPLERLARVAELRVETAGSGGEPEAVLSVLGAAEAQSLRADLLARRRAARPVADPVGSAGLLSSEAGSAEAGTPGAAVPAASGRLLKRLPLGDVVLAGATANEAGIIAAAAAGALQFADDLGVPFLERVGNPLGWLGPDPGAGAVAALVAASLFVLLFVGWVISIAGAVVRYHGFTLRREDGELRKRYGLLTVHETSVPLERVQAVRVEESWLRQALGLASLMIETAGAGPGEDGRRDRGAEAFVPLAHRGEVARLVRGIFDDFDLDAAPLRPVHPRARRKAWRRHALGLSFPALMFAFAAWLNGEPLWLLGSVALLPLPWLLARREYAVRGWASAQGYVVARSGVLGRVTWIVPAHKLQTLHLKESPLQRRHGLASLVVDTAAGGRQAVVADLGAGTARELLDALSASVRHSTRARRRGAAV